jgi:hypothetical protein
MPFLDPLSSLDALAIVHGKARRRLLSPFNLESALQCGIYSSFARSF